MSARPARIGDLEPVFRNLSPRMSREYARANLSANEAKAYFRGLIKRNQVDVLLKDDRPQALIAWAKREDGYTTAFAAEEPFFTGSTVRFCRKHMADIRARLGHPAMRAHSRSDVAEGQLVRWFKLIGFQEIEPEDRARVFELR